MFFSPEFFSFTHCVFFFPLLTLLPLFFCLFFFLFFSFLFLYFLFFPFLFHSLFLHFLTMSTKDIFIKLNIFFTFIHPFAGYVTTLVFLSYSQIIQFILYSYNDDSYLLIMTILLLILSLYNLAWLILLRIKIKNDTEITKKMYYHVRKKKKKKRNKRRKLVK